MRRATPVGCLSPRGIAEDIVHRNNVDLFFVSARVTILCAWPSNSLGSVAPMFQVQPQILRLGLSDDPCQTIAHYPPLDRDASRSRSVDRWGGHFVVSHKRSGWKSKTPCGLESHDGVMNEKNKMGCTSALCGSNNK